MIGTSNMINKALLTDIELMYKACSGKQKEFFKAELDAAKGIQCSKLSDVFTKKEIARIKALGLQKKDCYRNANLVTHAMPDRCSYVEGRVLVCGVPVDHAFVKVGDRYVDPTLEILLNEDVTKLDYCSILELDCDTLFATLVESGYYGNLFGFLFAKNH